MNDLGTPIHTELAEGLKVGDFLFLSSVDALKEDGLSAGEDLRTNLFYVLRKLQSVCMEAGGDLEDMVQLRIYVSASFYDPASIRSILAELFTPLPALSILPINEMNGMIMADGTAVILTSQPASMGCAGCQGCAART
ncbi:MAG: RidA family protein [Solobacterium sp.]|nr:RidA family protein [Solobacterium sp.]